MTDRKECVDCGTVIDPRSTRCQACMRAARRKPCPSIAHYNNGCRCEPCTKLASAKRKEHRRANGALPMAEAVALRWARYYREHAITARSLLDRRGK